MAIGYARINVEALGDKALEARLRAVPASVERRLISSSLRLGTKIIADEIRKRAPRMTGAFIKSLKVRKGSAKRGVVQIKVFSEDMAGLAALGARRTKRVGARGAKREGYYPAAIEFGYTKGGTRSETRWVSSGTDRLGRPYTRQRVTRTTTGGVHVPARSFMRAALNAKRDDVYETIRKDLADGLEEIAANDREANASRGVSL